VEAAAEVVLAVGVVLAVAQEQALAQEQAVDRADVVLRLLSQFNRVHRHQRVDCSCSYWKASRSLHRVLNDFD
jgi:hypothetical protein